MKDKLKNLIKEPCVEEASKNVSKASDQLSTQKKRGVFFCRMPWEAVTITGQGKVKPCCQIRGDFKSLHESDLIKSYNSKSIQDVRKSFITGEVSKSCISCVEREESLNSSRRIWFYNKFKDLVKEGSDYIETISKEPEWLQMDINLSNQCNLKCRMCGVWGSHKWIDDEVKLSEPVNIFKREKNKDNLALKELSIEKLQTLIPHMSKVQRIDFKGGEPMLAKNHILFLDMLISEGINERVTLHYTTNGTVVNKNIINRLEKFKKIEIVFSIEGTDPLYSYIRGGEAFNTEQLVKNLEIYDKLSNVKIMTNVSIQAYNLPNLHILYKFLHNLQLKNYSPKKAFNCIVNSPKYLSPFVWPKKMRDQFIENLNGIDELEYFKNQLIKQPFNTDDYGLFLKFTKRLDKIRNEDYFKIYPALMEKNYYDNWD